MSSRTLSLLLLAALLPLGLGSAQASCAGPAYDLARSFVGTWQEYELTPRGNTLSGTLTVALDSGSCALTQRFASPDESFSFRSLGYVDPHTGGWLETFVMSDGRVATYRWRVTGSEVLFERVTEENEPWWRLRVTERTPRSFVAVGERSHDRGASWERVDRTLTLKLPGAAEHTLDHLVVAISDLDRGSEHWSRLTGVRPVPGGEHPDRGTHNALVSLGPGSYLEILAPRADAGEDPLLSWIATMEELTPILWAVSTSDAAATRAVLAEAGFETSAPRAGSRETPGGQLLEWTTFGITEPQLAAAPFFIQWGPTTPHPSVTSPEGCRLTRLEVVSNDNPTMERLLEILEVEVEIAAGPRPALRGKLDCPAGSVELPAPDP